MRIDLEYLLPLKLSRDALVDELARYVCGLAEHVEVTVVDGSDADTFRRNAARFGSSVRHVRPDADRTDRNGKVAGVCTGLRISRHDKLIIADDDVRYTPDQLAELAGELDAVDIVRPQNYFVPLPWHARWDTARTLLNRAAGGDYPGTLAVRVTPYLRRHGYCGDVLFENLELLRTVRALGGSERVRLDLFVVRRPPPTGHFLRQRVRQAYDSLGQPARLAAELSILPIAAWGYRRCGVRGATAMSALVVAAAEFGRRRAGGARRFSRGAALWAVPWLIERGICAWVALALRVAHGGVRYGDGRIERAATPLRELRRTVRAVAPTARRPVTSPGSPAPRLPS